jgi:hypothetical protein
MHCNLFLDVSRMYRRPILKNRRRETSSKRQKAMANDPSLTATPIPAPLPGDIASSSSGPALAKISQPSTPSCDQPSHPTNIETPTNKRNFFDTSFGSRLTETTPKKLSRLQAKVQSLQHTVVMTMIIKLTCHGLRDGNMFMAHTPYFRGSPQSNW